MTCGRSSYAIVHSNIDKSNRKIALDRVVFVGYAGGLAGRSGC
jgi:hypothetical protein